MGDAAEDLRDHLEKVASMRHNLAGTWPGAGLKSGERLVLRYGRPFPSVPMTGGELEFVLAAMRYHRYPIKECFRNALLLAMGRPEFEYVEGYALDIIPVLHCWVSFHGKVVDPTWAAEHGKRQPRWMRKGTFGEFAPNRAYFGITLPKAAIEKRALAVGYYPSVVDAWRESERAWRDELVAGLTVQDGEW